MTKGKRYRSLYLPAWTIVAAVLILLAVIAVSTYRTMSRERGRMEESLLREASVIIRAVEASVRADFPSSPPDVGRLQKLVEEVSREPEVASITIFDREGAVTAANPPVVKVREAGSLEVLVRERMPVTRYRQLPGGGEVFEVIELFRLDPAGTLPGAQGAPAKPTGMILKQWSEDKMIALGLRTASFETARREDRHHTLLMAGILIALGGGALFFVFIVQNYYLVDRTLDRMRSYTENVVESVADGLITLDRDGRIVTLNRQALEILGARQETLEGRNIADILGAQGKKLPVVAGGDALVREQEMDILRWESGEKIPISVSAAPLKDEEGREMGSVLLVKDLRQIRDLQETVRRSERLASLGRLAAGVAHEIRNPLSSIRGFAQYFAQRFKGQKEEEGYAQVMVKEVDRLNGVIADLLDFAGPKEPRREAHAPEALAEHALKLLAPDLAARKIDVVKEYEPGLPAIFVDRDRITQVFLNVLINAAESMNGGGTIRMGLKRSASPRFLEIGIADTGPGIPREDLEKVFEPFFSRKKKGTGLGLAIVHQIIESHGGNVTVESREGEGTVFTIHLPFVGGEEQA